MNDADLRRLEQRLGAVYARQRLGIETDHEAQIFGQGLNFFHPENWYAAPSVIRAVLKMTGLYWRGCRNAARVQVRRNDLTFAALPAAFDGFILLHISDPHVEMNEGAMRCASELLPGLSYDACVLTGDYRAATAGPFDHALKGLAALCGQIKGPIYGVLGNHDTIRMVPGLEDIGIKMLLNECAVIARGDERIHLAGIDDAHFFRVDNIEKAASEIPQGGFSILLSHTPEVYRQAAHAGFSLILSGHTHGGQLCLPGRIPITLDSALPRRMGAGAWTYNTMAGYTSVGLGSSIVAARINCLPEITLHRLLRA